MKLNEARPKVSERLGAQFSHTNWVLPPESSFEGTCFHGWSDIEKGSTPSLVITKNTSNTSASVMIFRNFNTTNAT